VVDPRGGNQSGARGVNKVKTTSKTGNGSGNGDGHYDEDDYDSDEQDTYEQYE